MMNDGLKLRGDVALVLRDKDGNVKDERKIENLIVNAGLNFICDRMKNDETAMTHMALGSGSTAAAASDTSLGSQLGSREVLDSSTVTANQIVYVSSFEAGKATGAVTEAGIFNAASGGTMLCRTVFSVVNKAADDVLSVNWTITLTAS
jgi:alpha-D-ribose 1-methylphosphonate 5-triphosphate synthase subunit PhnH